MQSSSQKRLSYQGDLKMKNLKPFSNAVTRLFLIAMFLLPLLVGITRPATAAPDNSNGAVYTLTNSTSGNEVLLYERSASGALSFQAAYPTGGLGSGAGLGSQSAVILSKDNRWLYAVNAGSNQISTFAVSTEGLELVDVVDSGGVYPISLTLYKDWLYVLNAGDSGNISGFEIAQDGSLSPIVDSTQPVSNGGIGAAPGLAQIAFSSDGTTLVVTEKTTNLIDTYEVVDGTAGAPVSHPSSGAVPFGFAFDRHGHAIVSEASGAVSSYQIDGSGFNVISPSVANMQVAACWIAISKNGNFAYTTNAGSGSISSYRLGEDGSLTLLNPVAGSTGAGSSPVDMAFSLNGRYLYALGAASHTISIFELKADGSLASIGNISVPAGVVGLAAH
jgi:6-phosphogluconolactonase (cycloisomerase 2 family)